MADLKIVREWTDVLGVRHYEAVEDVVPVMVVHEVGREDVLSEPGGFATDDEWIAPEKTDFERNVYAKFFPEGVPKNLFDVFL